MDGVHPLGVFVVAAKVRERVNQPLNSNRCWTRCLRSEAEIGDHGANHHQPGDGQRGQYTGPKAHAIKRHEERALRRGDVEAEFFRKGCSNGDGEDESAGPHNRDSYRQLKSLREDIHGSFT
jgi:hypothetical protein